MVQDNKVCYHCGDAVNAIEEHFDDKVFCCSGCLSVYKILNQHKLLNYYCLNEKPGFKSEYRNFEERFKFLDIDSIVAQIIKFKNSQQTQVELYLPQIHCSSCLWLLENLNEMHEGVIYTKVNFTSKRIFITFDHNILSLKQLVSILSSIGYEPLIDLYQPEQKRLEKKYNSKSAYLKIGVAGFCFSNIMLISFPEYLGLDPNINPTLNVFFKWVCLLLSLPVIFYSAREFFENSYYSFRQKYINIDVPIALAITVTFIRSLYEVLSGTGAGFFDSMTGIVFFMLLGRTLQNRTYTTLSFNKNIQSYFPLAVSRVDENGLPKSTKVQELKENDILYIHAQEVIPTDCILSKGDALIDYSFITGEAMPESIDKGSIIYAGGRNVGSSIEVLVLKPFSENSFTQLWNNSNKNQEDFEKESKTTLISRYFSYVVILISLAAFVYWQFRDPRNSWNAATAVLIIACPCALLLTASFTQGYLLEMLARHGIYFKNADVIEKISRASHVAFDKTGTLTDASSTKIINDYCQLDIDQIGITVNAMRQSTHPLSQSLVRYLDSKYKIDLLSLPIEELPGNGLYFKYEGNEWRIGSSEFAILKKSSENKTQVYISINYKLMSIYTFEMSLMPGVNDMVNAINKEHSISLISGDNSATLKQMKMLLPEGSEIIYNCTPEDKYKHIKSLQDNGNKVIMVGDGINDAAALRQSDIGVTLVKDSFSFTPASDVIMEANHISILNKIIELNKGAMKLIWLGFLYSLIFNIIGIYFSVNGDLSPMIAAILMPSSSLGIILIAYIGMRFLSKKYFSKVVQSEVIEKADKNHVLT